MMRLNYWRDNAKLTGTGPSENQQPMTADPGVRVQRLVVAILEIRRLTLAARLAPKTVAAGNAEK